MIIDKPVISTVHFNQKRKELGINYWELLYMIPLAAHINKPDLPDNKYSDTMKHLRYKDLVITYKIVIDSSKLQLGESILLITINRNGQTI